MHEKLIGRVEPLSTDKFSVLQVTSEIQVVGATSRDGNANPRLIDVFKLF